MLRVFYYLQHPTRCRLHGIIKAMSTLNTKAIDSMQCRAVIALKSLLELALFFYTQLQRKDELYASDFDDTQNQYRSNAKQR